MYNLDSEIVYKKDLEMLSKKDSKLNQGSSNGENTT